MLRMLTITLVGIRSIFFGPMTPYPVFFTKKIRIKIYKKHDPLPILSRIFSFEGDIDRISTQKFNKGAFSAMAPGALDGPPLRWICTHNGLPFKKFTVLRE